MDNIIIPYLIKVSVALALFYGLYILCLKKDTFFNLRRYYFLFAMVFSLGFPLLTIEIPLYEGNETQLPVYWLSEMDEVIVDTDTEKSAINIGLLLFAGLALISIILAIKFLIQLCSIVKLKVENESEKIADCKIVKLKDKKTQPFSFFNWIFLNYDGRIHKNIAEIITHEQVHVRQYHSVDVILAEILCICFWWNPFAWLLKKEMRINHEYLADQGVLQAGFNTKEYQYILLHESNKNIGIPLINNFNVSQLKKRITMMNKEKTSLGKATKYLMIIPLGIALLLGNAVQASSELIDLIPEELQLQEPLTKVEQMPAFPGGEKELAKFLSQNLKYPVSAQKAKISGRVILGFIITKTGEIKDIKVVRGIDQALNDEAIRVAKLMPKWVPGKQNGTEVDTDYRLPVVFRLSGDKSVKISPDEVVVTGFTLKQEDASAKNNSRPFTTVEKMPTFPGGESAMQKFIADNLKYPKESMDKGIQGRVTVRFIVEATGEITEVKVIRGIDPLLDAEAVKVIEEMPKWIPGKQNGQTVRTYYTLPLVYRLKGDKEETDKN